MRCLAFRAMPQNPNMSCFQLLLERSPRFCADCMFSLLEEIFKLLYFIEQSGDFFR